MVEKNVSTIPQITVDNKIEGIKGFKKLFNMLTDLFIIA